MARDRRRWVIAAAVLAVATSLLIALASTALTSSALTSRADGPRSLSAAGHPTSTSAASGSTTPGVGPAGSSRTSESPLAALPPTPGPLAHSITSPPTSVTIASIGVTSSLEALALEPDGTLAPPSTFPEAGWYTGGVRPGDDGPAVIAGHVDSYRGPAVFFRLRDLKPGDPVVVGRADGSTVRFVVESLTRYPKAEFPTDVVYGPTPTPELRLITCTGTFDRALRSYTDNLVVTAVLAS